MKKYLIYSTVFSVFSEILTITVGIDLKLFYLIVLINLPLILIYKGFENLFIEAWHFIIICFFVLSGILSIWVFKTNIFSAWIEQFVGITLCSYFYYQFFTLFKTKEELNEIFKLYADIVFVLIVIGFFIYPFDKYNVNDESQRFRTIFSEPAHFATVCMPAFFYFINGKNWYKIIITTIAMLLTISSVAFIGLLLCLLLRFKFSVVKFFATFSAAIIFSIILYNTVPEFRLRLDDSSKSFKSSSLEKVNLSTYVFFSNVFVVQKVFQQSPILGNGLGSHYISREKYVGKIEGVEGFEQYLGLNYKDANSLFLRIVSDMGIVGVLFVLFFLAKNYVSGSSIDNIMCKGILVYLLLKLFREGHYFSVEMYFFVLLYFINKKFIIEANEPLVHFGYKEKKLTEYTCR